jgi:hypothetical protein
MLDLDRRFARHRLTLSYRYVRNLFMDVFLSLVVVISQVAMAALGLIVTTRPPPPNRKKWFEAAFYFVAILGIGATSWGAWRTSAAQEHLSVTQDHVANGVDQLLSRTPVIKEIHKSIYRRFSLEEKETISGILSVWSDKDPHVVIISVMNDASAFQAADEWMSILRSAKWDASGINQAIYTRPIVGVLILVKNADVVGANALRRAFYAVGITTEGSIDPSQKDGEISVIFGSEPKS